MPKLKFNPPFKGPPVEIVSDDAALREAVRKFKENLELAEVDEIEGHKMYSEMAKIAAKLGQDEWVKALRGIAEDENRHLKQIYDMMEEMANLTRDDG